MMDQNEMGREGAMAADAGQRRDGTALSAAEAARRHWLGVLARAEETELAAALQMIEKELGQLPAATFLRRPQIGMTMIRGRMGGTGGLFNFSEMTVTRCTLQLKDGRLGCGYLAGRRPRAAELTATLDALLQDQAHGARWVRSLIQPLAARQAAARRAQLAKSAPTKVEFFTLVRGENPA